MGPHRYQAEPRVTCRRPNGDRDRRLSLSSSSVASEQSVVDFDCIVPARERIGLRTARWSEEGERATRAMEPGHPSSDRPGDPPTSAVRNANIREGRPPCRPDRWRASTRGRELRRDSGPDGAGPSSWRGNQPSSAPRLRAVPCLGDDPAANVAEDARPETRAHDGGVRRPRPKWERSGGQRASGSIWPSLRLPGPTMGLAFSVFHQMPPPMLPCAVLPTRRGRPAPMPMPP
jgi:hypothetical protein